MYEVRNEDNEVVTVVQGAASLEHARATLIRRGYAIVGVHPTFGWIIVK